MEKEQKKLLLVAVSVGVFLLVTVTAAIVVMTPKANIEQAAFTSSQSYPMPMSRYPVPETVPIQPVHPVQPTQSAQPAQSAQEIINGFNLDVIEGDRLTINIPRPTTAAVPNTTEVPSAAASRPVATVAPVRTAPAAAPAAAAPASRPAATASTTAATRPAATPAPARQAPARTTNDFWVQTGAFSAQVRAEDAKELLASKGITSIIENRQIDGKTWYRVRLGPYTSEKEANYWLALVKTIDGFGESQVRQTVRQQ